MKILILFRILLYTDRVIKLFVSCLVVLLWLKRRWKLDLIEGARFINVFFKKIIIII
jgi:hypothetical protein